MPAAARTSKAKTKSSKSNASSARNFRETLEAMYTLHLLLLVVMTCLGAAMFVIVIKQRIQIQNLEFKLDFASRRYDVLNEYKTKQLEEGEEQGEMPEGQNSRSASPME